MFEAVAKGRLVVLAVALLALTRVASANPKSRVLSEHSQSLGFGFRQVAREVEVPGAFEGISYFSYLYFRNLQLTEHDTYSIAPSGRYAIFQDGPSGDIVLFTAATRTKRVIQKYSGVRANGYKWGADEKEITISLDPMRVSVE